MSASILVLDFEEGNSFTYDNTKIEFNGNFAVLKGPAPYSITNPRIDQMGSLLITELVSFTNFANKPALTEVTHILNIRNVDYWWSGTAWAVSDGTYSQSNTSATINANKASFNALLGDGVQLRVKTFLHTSNVNDTPEQQEIHIEFRFVLSSPAALPLCTCYLNLEDILNNINFVTQNATLHVKNRKMIKEGDKVVVPFEQSVAFNNVGFAQIDVIQTAVSGEVIQFFVTYDELNGREKQITLGEFTIPAEATIDIYDLMP